MGQRGQPGFLASLSAVQGWVRRHARLLFLLELVGAGIYQWLKWRQDRKRLRQVQPIKPGVAPEEWPTLPKVTVLVAAWNEENVIQAHIESVLSLRYPNLEYILCAGGDDQTLTRARQYTNTAIILLPQSAGEGKQNALRRGLELASGEIIYLTDADCLLSNDAFEAVVTPIILGREQAVSGRFRPLIEQSHHPFVQMQWCVDHYGRARMPEYINGLIGRNAALTRSLLKATGDFQKSVRIGTDYYLALQILALGEKIYYVPDSMVATKFHTDFRLYLYQQSRWLRNILYHSGQFQARNAFWNAFGQCLSGVLVVLVILFSPLSIIFALIGPGLIAYGSLARFRYLGYGARTLKIRINPLTFLLAPFFFLLDQMTLAYALFSITNQQRRTRW